MQSLSSESTMLPMDLTLSWDLFVIVFFALVITYSFIIGKHETIKLTVASYIALVAVHGIGNVLTRLSGESKPLLSVLGLGVDSTVINLVKLGVFVCLIIIISTKSGLDIEYESEHSTPLSTLITVLFGAATAGLMLSILLSFVTATPFFSLSLADTPVLASALEQSKLMQAILYNQDLWISLPALLLIAVGFSGNKGD